MARPPKKQDDFDVLVPLSKLVALLDSAQKVDELSAEMSRMQEQMKLLRGQFVECMDKIRELDY